jgi:hypothetical protein
VALTHPVTRQERAAQLLLFFDQVLGSIASANPALRSFWSKLGPQGTARPAHGNMTSVIRGC